MSQNNKWFFLVFFIGLALSQPALAHSKSYGIAFHVMNTTENTGHCRLESLEGAHIQAVLDEVPFEAHQEVTLQAYWTKRPYPHKGHETYSAEGIVSCETDVIYPEGDGVYELRPVTHVRFHFRGGLDAEVTSSNLLFGTKRTYSLQRDIAEVLSTNGVHAYVALNHAYENPTTHDLTWDIHSVLK